MTDKPKPKIMTPFPVRVDIANYLIDLQQSGGLDGKTRNEIHALAEERVGVEVSQITVDTIIREMGITYKKPEKISAAKRMEQELGEAIKRKNALEKMNDDLLAEISTLKDRVAELESVEEEFEQYKQAVTGQVVNG